MSYLDLGQKFITKSMTHFAAVLAVFYVSGFLSFLAYYRVLGIENITGSTQIYAEFAGRNLTLIIQTFLMFPLILWRDKMDFSWGGDALILWFGVVILLVLFELFARYVLRPKNIVLIKNKALATLLCFCCLTSITLPVMFLESEITSVRNVLQPFEITDFYEIQNNVLEIQEEKRISKTLSKKDIFKNLEKFSEKVILLEPETSIRGFFRMNIDRRNLEGGDVKRLYAFMTLILVVTATIVLLFAYHSIYQYEFIEIVLIIFIVSQVLFVPFLYGILGKEYKFPVVSFSFKATKESTVVRREGVILLETTSDRLIIYDRLNFFRIDYIERSSVINLQKVFVTSPFSNCSDERFRPCELYML